MKKYLFGGSINLNNRDTDMSFSAAETIEFLRQRYRSRFKWDGEIVFFPNCHYAKRTVFENMRESGRPLFTNGTDTDSPLFRGYDFTRLESPDQLDVGSDCFLFWEGSLPEDAILPPNVFLMKVLDQDDVDIGRCDAFCTKITDGLSILCYVHGDLKPVYVGSGTATITGRYSFQSMGDFCQVFECGTGNTPLLLHLYGEGERE